MARKIKIIAKFYDDCAVIKDGKIITDGVDYDCAKKKAEKIGGEVWQNFIDEDGYLGKVYRPYDCSYECD